METDMGVFAHPVSNSGMREPSTKVSSSALQSPAPGGKRYKNHHHWPTVQLVSYLPKLILKTAWDPEKVPVAQSLKVLR